MTTYNSYEAAKIANPDKEILTDHKKVEFTAELGLNYYHKCNPADYCMTVERFLGDGYRFVDGDLYIDWKGCVRGVGMIGHSVDACNDVRYIEDSLGSYILRAAALEERVKMDNSVKYVARKQFDEILKMSPISQEPRTKVEYVKWNFECAWHAIKAFKDGEKLYTKRSHKDFILIDSAQDVLRFLYDLHERIETPITWQEELYDYLDSSCEMSDDFDDSFTIGIEGKPLEFNLNDDEFVDMCKFVASLNSVN